MRDEIVLQARPNLPIIANLATMHANGDERVQRIHLVAGSLQFGLPLFSDRDFRFEPFDGHRGLDNEPVQTPSRQGHCSGECESHGRAWKKLADRFMDKTPGAYERERVDRQGEPHPGVTANESDKDGRHHGKNEGAIAKILMGKHEQAMPPDEGRHEEEQPPHLRAGQHTLYVQN